MRHERLVPLCPSAFQERREDVPWDSLGIFPLAKDMRWPQGPVGFVSSFGFGGAGAVCGFERPQKAEASRELQFIGDTFFIMKCGNYIHKLFLLPLKMVGGLTEH